MSTMKKDEKLNRSSEETNAVSDGNSTNSVVGMTRLRTPAEVNKDIDSHLKEMDSLVKKNDAMADEMRRMMATQQNVFGEAGIELGDPDCVIKQAGKRLKGLDEFAKLAIEHEKRVYNSIGLKEPDGGWDLALACAERRPVKNTMGDISKLLSWGTVATPGAVQSYVSSVGTGESSSPKKYKPKVRRLKV
ncbi:MAG: hypothetical protein LBR91_01935 [Puniceicoccales bacterium]|nr:hypothetical protein [Puniceicoccales bacterium]